MPRYIDAEKLEKDGWSASRTYQQDEKTMVYETKKMTDFPTVDVVEVVRCKDCKHRPTGTAANHDLEFPDDECPCQNEDDWWYSWRPPDDWFCACGERKGDDAE